MDVKPETCTEYALASQVSAIPIRVPFNATARLAQFRENLQQKHPKVTILQHPKRVRIAMSVHLAMELVDTEFVYVLQHDMPFLQDVRHEQILQTMQEYPNVMRLVRFKNHLRSFVPVP